MHGSAAWSIDKYNPKSTTGVTNDAGAMQPAQNSRRDWGALTAAQNQKPGSGDRPGSILQFQFPQ
jgi:hypothetical protein